MSATVDQRVVEMRFDNRQFESNVSTTMSTLDKLKQRLNLSGAAKGLESVGTAANGISFSGLGSAVETIQAKFSAMQVVGITALANITNSAVNAGKSIIRSLTIDPIKTGFSEYETKMGSVQTILANTEHQGTTLNDVTQALDELNLYADKTIYNFQEMTRNIGTFTAAGVDLNTSVRSIQGIANLAAVSGSTSQQASTAMYQLSQALSTGTVKLQDWNSVVNAGMGGKVFQNALIQTAAMMDGASADVQAWQKEHIDAYGSFRESLSRGEWLTSEVLTKTLEQFTMSAQEGSDEWNKFKQSLIDDGYTEEQAKSILKMANTATDAATKVKTFTQLMDTLKESAQSGWAQTWELLVGDFEEAKSFFTELSDLFGGIIGKSAEKRNALLGDALTSNYDKLISKLKDAGIETDRFEASLRNVVGDTNLNELIEEFGSLDGAIKEGKISSDKIKEAIRGLGDAASESMSGLSKIKETLKFGSTGEDVEALQKALIELGYDLNKYGATGEFNWETMLAVKEFQKANNIIHDGILGPDTLAALKKTAGVTDNVTIANEELIASCNELADVMTKKSGRELLLESVMNIIKAVQKPLSAVGEAFDDVFSVTSDQLYSVFENVNKFTESMIISSEVANKIKRIFKGVFSIFDIGRKIITSIADSFLDLAGSSGISNLGTFILDTLVSLGDFFTKLNDTFDISGFSGMLSTAVSGISNFLGITTDKIQSFGDVLSTVGGFISKALSSIWDGFKVVFGWVSENFSAGDIFAGLAGSGIFIFAKKLIGFVKKIDEAFDGGIMGLLFGKGDDSDGGGIKDKISDLFDGVSEAFESFSASVKTGSFVAIAAAILMLSAAFEKISGLDAIDIAKSLTTMGIALGVMMKAINSMPTNTKFASGLTKFSESTNLIKSGISLMLMAKAIGILADSITKLSGLSWEELAKGLVGVGGGIVLLCGGLKILNGTKVSLTTSVAMLALAEACKILGDAMQKFVGFSWDEIGRGLAGMGGALGEMVAALAILSKVGGFGAMLGGIGILIAVQSLSDLAEGLKQFGDMSWDEIGRGVVAMGGALGEVTIALGILGKVAGFSSIFASGAIFIVTQGLSDLATSFKEFGSMAWDEIGRGVVAMGGALGEVAGITGLLGYLAGFAGIFGAGAIWVTVQSLTELAVAFKEFGSMAWDEIGRGVVAMGGALLEVAGITGALGYLAGFAGILGGAAIWVAVQGLSDLAIAFQSFGDMSWGDIGRGVVAMGAALLEVAGISGALGYLAGFAGLLGGAAIWVTVQGLGDLADAFKKFGDMSWDEIGRGLAGMGAALSELAAGSLLNVLSGFGASAIAEMAAPLGVLADSVKKWSGVSVPADLGANLSSLAPGVKAFTFGGLGAGALAEAAPGVGTLADSVKKWAGVTVPENLGTSLETLASGVKAFTFGGMGAESLTEAAPGVGAMADSVAKWSGVTVPENLGTTLASLGNGVQAFTFGGSGASSLVESAPGVSAMADSVAKWSGVTVPADLGNNLTILASGVKAFTFGGSGAGSLTEAAPGVGILADSVKKWTGVTVPDNLGTNLDALATGVKQFTFGGSGAETISTVASALGVMADSVIKWTGVTVPENLGTNLSALASGVKSFTFGGSGAESLSTASTGLGTMADAVAKWSTVTVPEGLCTQMSTLAGVIKDFAGLEDVAYTATEVDSLAAAISKFSGVDYAGIESGLSGISTAISNLSSVSSDASGLGTSIYNGLVGPLKNAADGMSSVGNNIVSAIESGIKSGQSSLNATAGEIVNTMGDAVKSHGGALTEAGSGLAAKIADGIKSGTSSAASAATSLTASTVSAIRANYIGFYSAGAYCATGFVNGINNNTYNAYAAGTALGIAALEAAKKALLEQSPSRAFYEVGAYAGEGFVNGIDAWGKNVSEAGYAMGDGAVRSISNSVNKVSDAINADMDMRPTIRPVVDLSDVKSKAANIGDLLGGNSPVGVMANVGAIGSMMGRRSQNGADSEIVSAINKLRKDLGNMPRESYSINGITYDDGSNVANAMREIVRAAKTGRRV
jgi:tape measure domain-containing protein